MPRYFMERTVGDVTREQLDEIADKSQRIREERFPEITWEHTHVVRTQDGLKAFCVYESPNPDSVRAHAEALGLPVERFYEVETDLSPIEATAHGSRRARAPCGNGIAGLTLQVASFPAIRLSGAHRVFRRAAVETAGSE